MAYNIYICCDRCGNESFSWINTTVSLYYAIRIARMHGWMVTQNNGFYCPSCKEKLKAEKRKQKALKEREGQ